MTHEFERFLECMPWPDGTVITQEFGENGHRGRDGWTPPNGMGAPIVPGAPGVIVRPTNDGSFGNAVCIDYGNGLFAILAHNNEVLVNVGDRVTARQVVAFSGWTGYVEPSGPRGAHCHFQLCVNTQFPTDISYSRDPRDYLIPEADMEAIDNLMRRMDRVEATVAKNGMMIIPWADTEGEESVLGCFPAGTTPTPRDHPDPDSTMVMVTGEAAIEYCRIRGFSLGYGVLLARQGLAQHVASSNP